MARDTDGGGRDGRGRRGDQPADEARGRRRGRNEPEEVPGEELGWLDDLRSALAHFSRHPITVPISKEESSTFNHL